MGKSAKRLVACEIFKSPKIAFEKLLLEKTTSSKSQKKTSVCETRVEIFNPGGTGE